jgi:hypothetical protein
MTDSERTNRPLKEPRDTKLATIKSHCNSCGGPTNHSVLHKVTESGVDRIEEGIGIDWEKSHMMVRCCGCDCISLRVVSSNSECCDEEGRPLLDVRYYPPRIFRAKPLWLLELGLLSKCPPEIPELLDELYVCLQNDCSRAATMAARALLEHILISTCGDQGTFKDNVEAFEKAGHLSRTQRRFLNTVLDAGHATIHRSFNPSRDDLSTVVDIVENLVGLLYVQKEKIELLKKRIPLRKGG